MTWVYGEEASDADVSEVELRLSTVDGGSTRFEFEHTAVVPDEMWAEYGPGAVGVGWDGGLLGLSLHLAAERSATGSPGSCRTKAASSATRSSEAWGAANGPRRRSGGGRTRGREHDRFYAPDPDATS